MCFLKEEIATCEKEEHIKKILALVLAMIMVMAMGVTAFADPIDTTLKVEPVEGHTYTAYQLFVGDLAADGKTLSNVKWGRDVKESALTYYVKDVDGKYTVEATVTPKADDPVPEAVLDYLVSLSSKNSSDAAQATSNIISEWVTGTGTPITETDTTVKTGYYVVKDAYTNPDATQETTLSTVICEVVGPTTIKPKAGTTSHEKQVLDINDTTDTALDLSKLKDVATGWDKSADHDFGDQVPFKLTTTIGSDFAKYTNYYLAVNDTLKDGLILDPNSIEVYVDGNLASQGNAAGQYTLKIGPDNDPNKKTFKVEFNSLNGNTYAAAGKDVVVYYTATLDKETAVIGNHGNWNESYAEFSNNPNGSQEGKGKTPASTAVVFTYKTEVNKVDKDRKPLVGAEFTLTKKLQNGSTVTVAVIKYDKDGKVTTKTADGTVKSEGDATKFSFNGLDDGVYTLTETVTPNGYNTIDPVIFKVEAKHNATSGEGITDLAVKNEDGTDFSGELKFAAYKKEGSITTDVVNQSGSILPSTGGIGTTIFYIIGAILVIGAGVLLITRRRMKAE